jgi:hypothetical protein
MSPHQIIALAARLFAVWLAINLPGQVYEVLFTEPSARLFVVCILIIEVVAMLALWFFPHAIARTLLTVSTTEAPAPSSAETWLRMGCALIGLWVLATSFPKLIVDAFGMYFVKDDDPSLQRAVLYYLAEVAIAVWLILGGRGFREVFWWARNAGVSKPSGGCADPPETGHP